MPPTSRLCDHESVGLTDGEQWCRTELRRLADGRWQVRPWFKFLGAAWTRAEDNRRSEAALRRQARRWIGAGAGAWLIAGRRLPASTRQAGLLWWTACGLMLDWHLGMVETDVGEPARLGVADALTLTRAWLVPAVARAPSPALLLLGGLTDVVDGKVARATRCTRLGRDLEGTVDACFSVAALRGARRTGGLSALPVALEGVRLSAGTAYVTRSYFGSAQAPDRAVPRSGRWAAPVRLLGLMAAGLGQRRIADRLILASTAIATAALFWR